MGRPKEHNEHRAGELLEAAERTVETAGVEGLSVRGVAETVGTTTRAVYSLFGSKGGLVAALGAKAFEMLGAGLAELPVTDKPSRDLVDACVLVFRPFVTHHPSLFRIGFHHGWQAPPSEALRSAQEPSWEALNARVDRLRAAGLLIDRSVEEATIEFHALCEGLATLELRGLLPAGREKNVWYDAASALVNGFGLPSATARDECRPADGGSTGGARRK
ncbi:MAG TPA: TetR/AcrR family transcriptional regulator [Acidimicrobiales bacterium]|nr:TetR/AcrR family transcriptional regulator [Acidimicrobiales bacterium]